MGRGVLQSAVALLGTAVLGVAASGCGDGEATADVVNGKEKFIAKCGSCHVLRRAGTTGTVGPNLDLSFQRAILDGMGRGSIRGVVHNQIRFPATRPQLDPVTEKAGASMPANLVKGGEVDDVAAYVAQVAAAPGEDMGQLGQIGVKKATGTAVAKNGRLNIPADPSGGLAYVYASATATAGRVTISSPNSSAVDHNIAIEGGGVNQVGPVVKNGGVSTISVTLKPGKYTFYCTLPGHRAGGMYGTLTVK